MSKKFNRMSYIVAAAFCLNTVSCAHQEFGYRFPAEVSKTKSVKINLLDIDPNAKELAWLKSKTPAKDVVFAQPEIERKYQDFLNIYHLADTLDRRHRFSAYPTHPFSIIELAYLENLDFFNQPYIKAKKGKKVIPQSADRNVKRSNVATKTTAVTKKGQLPVTRVRITQGKPSWVDASYWIAADVATTLEKQGIPFNDVILFYKMYGFYDLKTGKALSGYDQENRYKTLGSKGQDWVDLTEKDIEMMKAFSGLAAAERVKTLNDIIQKGYSISDYQEVLLANGVTREEIEEAKNINSPKYKEAYIRGQNFKVMVDKLSQGESPSLARIQAEKNFGYITEAEYQKKYNDEKAAVDKYMNETKNSWTASIANLANNFISVNKTNISNVASIYYGGLIIDPQITDTREEFAKGSLADKIKTYGSAANYYQHLKDVEEKYRFRPLGEPIAAAANLTKGAGQFVVSLLKIPDALSETTELPFTGEAFMKRVMGKPFEAKDASLYQASEAISQYIENLTPEYNKDFREKFHVNTAPKALGQLTVQMGLGVVSGGALVPVLIGVGAGATQSFDEAVKAGATRNQRKIMFAAGSFAGLIDGIPVAKFLKPLNVTQKKAFYSAYLATIFKSVEKQTNAKVATEVTRAVFARQMLTSGGKLLEGALTEGGTELLQKKITDLAKKMTYDPTQKVLFISDEDMNEFYAGAVGGVGGGGLQISLESNNVQDAKVDEAIEKQIGQTIGMMKTFPLKKVEASVNANVVMDEIKKYDAQIQANRESKRTDRPFLIYKQNLIQTQNVLLTNAKKKALSKEDLAYVDQRLQRNQVEGSQINQQLTGANVATAIDGNSSANVSSNQQNSGVEADVDAAFQREQLSSDLIAGLNKAENKLVKDHLKSKDNLEAFIELVSGKRDNQKNILLFLAPKESRRRVFFNQMIEKIAGQKLKMFRDQMIENTERVLKEPNCIIP